MYQKDQSRRARELLTHLRQGIQSLGALYATPGTLRSARGHGEAKMSRYVVDLVYQRSCERDNRESKNMSAIDI